MRIVLIVFSVLSLLSCRESSKQRVVSSRDFQEELIEANRQRLKEEMAEIKAFVKEKGWPVKESASGLHYWVYEDGVGPNAREGNGVIVDFKMTDLQENFIYDSGTNSAYSFRIDQDDVLSGLNEALKYMNLGSKAKLVLPSHLAYGFSGDNKKVQPNTILVMDIHFVQMLLKN